MRAVFELTTPLWLAGLLPLILLLRWLHRFRDDTGATPVSALFLWRGLEAPANSGSRRSDPDPIWRRRAIIASLALAALAGPVWTQHSPPPVTVWFDNSWSMQTHEEDGRSRTEMALTALFDELQRQGIGRAELRPLGGGYPGIAVNNATRGEALVRVRQWIGEASDNHRRLPALPLPTGRQHWLVTDGAAGDLRDWLQRARISRLLQQGEKTENSALTGLALRRVTDQPRLAAGLVTASNLGQQQAHRLLRVRADDETVAEWRLMLPRGGEVSRTFTVDSAGVQVITAQLTVSEGDLADPLAEDDRLALPVSETRWRLGVAVDTACGRPLQAALAAIPGVEIRPPADAESELAVVCSGQPPPGVKRVIRFVPQQQPQALGAPLIWHQPPAGLSWLTEEVGLLTTDGGAPPPPGQALLGAGETTLIALQRDPVMTLLEVRFDAGSPALVQHPGYPLLINRLLETALEQELLDIMLLAARPPQQSVITPHPLNIEADSGGSSGADRTRSDLTPWLVLMMAGLLLQDTRRSGFEPGGNRAARRTVAAR